MASAEGGSTESKLSNRRRADENGSAGLPTARESKASAEAATANEIADAATIKEAGVIELKAGIEKDLAAAEPALIAASAALDSVNKKDLGELKNLKAPPAGIDDVTGACIYLLHDGVKGKIDISWKSSQQMMKDVNGFLAELTTMRDGDTEQPFLLSVRPIRKGSELSWDYGDAYPYEKFGSL